MFRKLDQPPDTSPSKLPHSWMRVRESSFINLSSQPVRSVLLQESSKVANTANLTQGQILRLQVANTVKSVFLINNIEHNL